MFILTPRIVEHIVQTTPLFSGGISLCKSSLLSEDTAFKWNISVFKTDVESYLLYFLCRHMVNRQGHFSYPFLLNSSDDSLFIYMKSPILNLDKSRIHPWQSPSQLGKQSRLLQFSLHNSRICFPYALFTTVQKVQNSNDW